MTSHPRRRSDDALLGPRATAPARVRLARARLVVGLAARLTGPRFMVPEALITGPRPSFRQRGRARRPQAEAAARALTAYLAHTTGACSKKMIARVMAMDRAQITRAVNAIEDRRDDPAFEGEISAFEERLRCALAESPPSPGQSAPAGAASRKRDCAPGLMARTEGPDGPEDRQT